MEAMLQVEPVHSAHILFQLQSTVLRFQIRIGMMPRTVVHALASPALMEIPSLQW
jgi:hypothetical protein